MQKRIVLENVDLKKYNTYGIGGKAKYLIFPSDINDLKNLIIELNEKNISWVVLGGGSNVIIPDNDFNGAIIKLDKINDFLIDGDNIFLGAGLNLSSAILKLINIDYGFLAPLYGIPGTIGGAVVGNAGANGYSIFDDLLSVLVLKDNEITAINKDDINYSYRSTEFKNTKTIVLGATFKGQKSDSASSLEYIKELSIARSKKQPLEYPNAGSVFKNPEGLFAGKIIEELGLKNTQINGACVSDKHANFIINLGNAQSSDIIKLIELIKRKVKKEKNIDLELEQIIIKW